MKDAHSLERTQATNRYLAARDEIRNLSAGDVQLSNSLIAHAHGI